MSVVDDASVRWEPIVTGLRFPEGLRWRNGALYYSDVFAGNVSRIAVPGGVPEVLGEVTGRPSGLGFLPDGTLLAVSMRDRRVVSVVDRRTELYADLSSLAAGDCNDMLVDRRGRAYIGNFGYDYIGGEERRPAQLILVDVDRSARVVAEEVWFPNGMLLSPDGRTLLVAETSAERITAFTVADNGSLSDRRVFEELPGFRPDGLAADAEGSVWAASPGTAELARFDRNGTLTARWPAPGGMSQGCVLGGGDGRTLFVACSPTHDVDESAARQGSILATTVAVGAQR